MKGCVSEGGCSVGEGCSEGVCGEGGGVVKMVCIRTHAVLCRGGVVSAV